MTREKAIAKILSDTHLGEGFRYYVERKYDELGCGPRIDIETVEAIEKVIRNDFK